MTIRMVKKETLKIYVDAEAQEICRTNLLLIELL